MPSKHRELSGLERLRIRNILQPIFQSMYKQASTADGFPLHSVVPMISQDEQTQEAFIAAGSHFGISGLSRLIEDDAALIFIDEMIKHPSCEAIICDQKSYNEITSDQNTNVKNSTKSKAVVKRNNGEISLFKV